jgi:hypothetical protein
MRHPLSVTTREAIRRVYDMRYTASIARVLGHTKVEPGQVLTVPNWAIRMPEWALTAPRRALLFRLY